MEKPRGLGVEVKRRSPFRYSYVIRQANDGIGYIPDPAGFDRGGYQVWTGLHSLVERGLGASMVDEAVRILNQLARSCGANPAAAKPGGKSGAGL